MIKKILIILCRWMVSVKEKPFGFFFKNLVQQTNLQQHSGNHNKSHNTPTITFSVWPIWAIHMKLRIEECFIKHSFSYQTINILLFFQLVKLKQNRIYIYLSS